MITNLPGDSAPVREGQIQLVHLFKFLLLIPLLAASASHAKEDIDSDDDTETMIVTAHRIPVEASRIGSAVSTIDRKLLDERQSTFATDVLENLTSVAVSRTSGYGSVTDVRIRGAEANQVLVVIDGVEANDPALGDTFDFASLTSFDIESIELVRGPQSALWGSDAAAGVINIRTRRGEAGKSGNMFLEGGSNSTVSGGGNAAFNSDRSGVSVNGSYFDTDGEDATIEGDEDDGYDNLTLGLTAHWLPTQTSRLEFFGRYTEGNTEYDGTDFTTGLPADADNDSNDELTLLAMSGGMSLFEDVWDQSIRLTYLDSDHRQSTDGVESASTAGEKVGIYYQSTFNLPEWSNFNDQHLILALDYEDEDFKQRGTAFGSFDPNQNQSVDNIGYVAEFLTRPLRGFNLSASVRYDDNSDFDNVTTYRLTASYLLDRTSTRLHTSYGKSQKSPTFIERFGFFPDEYLGNPDLKPEKNKGFDIGIKQTLFAGRATADITYFNERLEDEIDGFVFDSDSGLFTADNLNGKSRRDGVEVEVQAKLNPGLNASATYTYTDSREPNDNGGRSRELRRPRHMASLNVNQLFLAGRANLNVNVSYNSDQRDRYFPPFPTPPEVVKLDSYVLLDVAGSFNITSRLEIYARATNALDKSYENVVGFQTPERAFYTGVKMRL